VGDGFGEVFASYSQGDVVCLWSGFKRGLRGWFVFKALLVG
jgi:hypothetical protein